MSCITLFQSSSSPKAVLFIAERTRCNLFCHYVCDNNMCHANVMSRDGSRLWSEKQNRLDLGHPNEIKVRKSKIRGAEEHVDPSRDFCSGKLNMQNRASGLIDDCHFSAFET